MLKEDSLWCSIDTCRLNGSASIQVPSKVGRIHAGGIGEQKHVDKLYVKQNNSSKVMKL